MFSLVKIVIYNRRVKNEQEREKNKKKKIISISLIVIAIIIIILCLRGCGKQTYTITFKDYDGTILEIQEVEKNKLPVFSGGLNRNSDEVYDYSFISWDKPIVKATKDETYTAVYGSSLIELGLDDSIKKPNSVVETINFVTENNNNKIGKEDRTENKPNYYWINFLDDDGTVLQRSEYEYGTMPSFNGTINDKTVGDYLYSFIGWDHAICQVLGTQTYKAEYNKTALSKDANKDNAPKKEKCVLPECENAVYVVSIIDATFESNDISGKLIYSWHCENGEYVLDNIDVIPESHPEFDNIKVGSFYHIHVKENGEGELVECSAHKELLCKFTLDVGEYANITNNDWYVSMNHTSKTIELYLPKGITYTCLSTNIVPSSRAILFSVFGPMGQEFPFQIPLLMIDICVPDIDEYCLFSNGKDTSYEIKDVVDSNTAVSIVYPNNINFKEDLIYVYSKNYSNHKLENFVGYYYFAHDSINDKYIPVSGTIEYDPSFFGGVEAGKFYAAKIDKATEILEIDLEEHDYQEGLITTLEIDLGETGTLVCDAGNEYKEMFPDVSSDSYTKIDVPIGTTYEFVKHSFNKGHFNLYIPGTTDEIQFLFNDNTVRSLENYDINYFSDGINQSVELQGTINSPTRITMGVVEGVR